MFYIHVFEARGVWILVGSFPLCSGECTLQDRCLLAMKQPLPGNLLAHHDDPDFLATLAQGPAHFSLSS